MDLVALKAEQKALKDKFEAEGKKALVHGVRAIFDKFPDVAAVRWTQYTPGFNDGEPCTFGVHVSGVRLLSQMDSDSSEESDEDDNEWDGTWHHEACKAFRELLKDADEICHAAFGDDKAVVIKRDGTVSVSDYDCGY